MIALVAMLAATARAPLACGVVPNTGTAERRADPAIAVERQVLAVKEHSPARRACDLAGKLVCFIIATPAEDALDAWAVRDNVPIERLAFQEQDEMMDAFDVGKCAAMAIDSAGMIAGAGLRTLISLAVTSTR